MPREPHVVLSAPQPGSSRLIVLCRAGHGTEPLEDGERRRTLHGEGKESADGAAMSREFLVGLPFCDHASLLRAVQDLAHITAVLGIPLARLPHARSEDFTGTFGWPRQGLRDATRGDGVTVTNLSSPRLRDGVEVVLHAAGLADVCGRLSPMSLRVSTISVTAFAR